MTPEQLRQAYSLTFNSETGAKVLEDLVERFDPIILDPPPNGDAALWRSATQRVMHHLREMLGDSYANAMARVDGRERRAGERPERVNRGPGFHSVG